MLTQGAVKLTRQPDPVSMSKTPCFASISIINAISKYKKCTGGFDVTTCAKLLAQYAKLTAAPNQALSPNRLSV